MNRSDPPLGDVEASQDPKGDPQGAPSDAAPQGATDAPEAASLVEQPAQARRRGFGGADDLSSREARFRYATYALAVGLLVLGCLWRFHDLAYPPAFAFDEHHFVRNARNYLTHQPDWNDHPPLGKLLLVPTMRAFGDNGVGWRVPSASFGVMLVALAGIIAAAVFRDRRVGLLAAAFVAIDGFFISYARVALLDTPMTFFIYAALALMLCGRSLPWFAAAAAAVGLAVATKWTGVCILLVAPWLLVRRRRSPLHAVWMFAVASMVYVAVVALALRITRQPISSSGMLGNNLALLKHHAGFTAWDNAASSKWYTWPFLVHPIVMHYASLDDGRSVRATTSLGNIVLWFSATAAIVWTVVGALRAAAARRGLSRRQPSPLLPGSLASPSSLLAPAVPAASPPASAREDAIGGTFLVVSMIALVLPFVLTRRQSYIFHYLGAYGLALVLLASWLVRLEARAPRAVFGFVVVATVVSIVYAPVWVNTVISRAGFLARLPFPGWR